MAAVLTSTVIPITNIGLKAEASLLTQVELIIKYARSLTGSRAYDGYCQRFIRVCYEAAGIYAAEYVLSSGQARKKWMVSASKEDIPVGAVLYFHTSAGGHSAIYLGNNRMIHGRKTVYEQEITPGFWRIYAGWGWQAGVKPTGAYVDSEEVLTGSIYKTNESLNLRKGPGTSFGKLVRIAKETKISITQTKQKDSILWGKTSYYSYEGWVVLEYCEYLYTKPTKSITTAADSSRTIYSVEIKMAPSKMFYRQGESINISGLSVLLTYNDDATEMINQGFTLNTSKAGIAGRSTVIISYEDFVVAYPIVVLSNQSELDKLGFAETKSVKSDFENSALIINADSYKVETLSALLDDNVQIYDKNGCIKESGEEVATGDYVILMDENNPAVAVICRKGDANGSGTINAVDYLIIKRLFLGTVEVDGYYKEAGDINKDNRIGAFDFLSLKRYVLGSHDIFN